MLVNVADSRQNSPPGSANAEPPEEEAQEPNPIDDLSEHCRVTLDRAVSVLSQWDPVAGVLGDLPQVTVPAEHIVEACLTCRDDAELDGRMLLCLACVDYEVRFELVYFLQSLAQERTLVIKANVSYDAPSLPTVIGVWPAADWYEREAHDLFGVVFEGHPDLSPLLLYPEFEGFPGRKEYAFNEYREF